MIFISWSSDVKKWSSTQVLSHNLSVHNKLEKNARLPQWALQNPILPQWNLPKYLLKEISNTFENLSFSFISHDRRRKKSSNPNPYLSLVCFLFVWEFTREWNGKESSFSPLKFLNKRMEEYYKIIIFIHFHFFLTSEGLRGISNNFIFCVCVYMWSKC